MSDSKIGVTANLDVRPQKSQTTSLLLFIFCFVFSLVGVFGMWNGKDIYWVCFIFSSIFLGSAFYLHSLSYKKIDLDNTTPTTVKVTTDGIEISADARWLTDNLKNLDNLGNTAIALANIRPLPVAHGMVTDAGVIIPNSDNIAKIKTEEANASAQMVIGENVSMLTGGMPDIVQPNELIIREITQN